jgi:hypothetical protein
MTKIISHKKMFLFYALLPQAEKALFIQMYASDTFVTRNRRKEEDEKALQGIPCRFVSFMISYGIHRDERKRAENKK